MPEAQWRARHRLILTVLACHVPALLIAGRLTDHPLRATVGQVGLITALAVVAAGPGTRVWRSFAATIGLLACATELVVISDGMTEAHFYFFLVLIFVALYQDWRPLLTAFVYVLAEQVIAGTLLIQRAYADGGGSTREAVVLTMVHAAFVIAAATVLGVFWGWSSRARAREESYRIQLMDTEMSAIARIREAGQMREDLMTSVSHEFRTPLTAIRGVVATLRSQGDRIAPEVRDALLDGIAEHEHRLSRLLEAMLAAASASMTDPAAAADVSATLESATRQPRVTATSDPDLLAALSPATLQQIVAAMVRHGRDHARDTGPVHLEGRARNGEVLVALQYVTDASTVECPRRLLEPFASRESAETGRPSSLDLYLARRLAEVHDGRMEAAVHGTSVTVTAHFRQVPVVAAAAATGQPPPRALSTPASGRGATRPGTVREAASRR
ncbi:MAG: histidine kinase dimerization/phospho-acceptor domain-containing protein [Mycobacteriales bacterium]